MCTKIDVPRATMTFTFSNWSKKNWKRSVIIIIDKHVGNHDFNQNSKKATVFLSSKNSFSKMKIPLYCSHVLNWLVLHAFKQLENAYLMQHSVWEAESANITLTILQKPRNLLGLYKNRGKHLSRVFVLIKT